MIIVAIDQHPEKKITVSELFNSLRNMFSFFCKDYTGWKNTIRSTLKSTSCFDRQYLFNKTTKWTVNYNKIPRNVFKLQKNSPVTASENWPSTLHEHLNIPEIVCHPTTDCCQEATPSRSHTGFSMSADNTYTTAHANEPSICIQPDLSFNIDNIFQDINTTIPEDIDDSRRTDCFDRYPLDVCHAPIPTLKISRPKPSKITQTKKYKELEQLINNHASNTFVSADIAIDNLRLLCNSIDNPSQKYKSAYSGDLPHHPVAATQPSPVMDLTHALHFPRVTDQSNSNMTTDSADIPCLVNISLLS